MANHLTPEERELLNLLGDLHSIEYQNKVTLHYRVPLMTKVLLDFIHSQVQSKPESLASSSSAGAIKPEVAVALAAHDFVLHQLVRDESDLLTRTMGELRIKMMKVMGHPDYSGGGADAST